MKVFPRRRNHVILRQQFRGPQHVTGESDNPLFDRPSAAPRPVDRESPAQSGANGAARAGAPRHRRFLDWLLLREAVAWARAEEIATAPRAAMVRLAHAYADAADVVFASEDRVSLAPVLSLYREAIFLLLAQDFAGKKKLAVAFETAPQSVFADTAEHDAALAQLRHVLALHVSLEGGGASIGERRDVIRVTQSSLRALLETADAGGLPRLLRRRRWRAGFAAGALLTVLALLVGLSVQMFGPKDLAAGQPWRASSSLAIAASVKVQFQTKEEQDPWFEIDLGRLNRIRSLSVKNRADCCQERAVPLVAEVSFDRTNWQAIAQTEAPFLVWEPNFPVVIARYLRFRASRRTVLHFEQVKVF